MTAQHKIRTPLYCFRSQINLHCIKQSLNGDSSLLIGTYPLVFHSREVSLSVYIAQKGLSPIQLVMVENCHGVQFLQLVIQIRKK